MKSLRILTHLALGTCAALFISACDTTTVDSQPASTGVQYFQGFNRTMTVSYTVSFDSYTPIGKERAPNWVVDQFQSDLNSPQQLHHVDGQLPLKFYGYQIAEGTRPDIIVQFHIHCDDSNNYSGYLVFFEPGIGPSTGIRIAPGGDGVTYRDPEILIQRCADLLNAYGQYGGNFIAAQNLWVYNGYGQPTHLGE